MIITFLLLRFPISSILVCNWAYLAMLSVISDAKTQFTAKGVSQPWSLLFHDAVRQIDPSQSCRYRMMVEIRPSSRSWFYMPLTKPSISENCPCQNSLLPNVNILKLCLCELYIDVTNPQLLSTHTLNKPSHITALEVTNLWGCSPWCCKCVVSPVPMKIWS